MTHDREISRRIAEEVMGEPEPPEVEFGDEYCQNVRFKGTTEILNYGTLRSGIGPPFGPYGDLSPKGAWYIRQEYHEGDRPLWTPLNFLGSLEDAERAFDAFAKGQGDGEPTLLMERYRGRDGKEEAEKWMAYYGMRYGYGATPAEAICKLILVHLDEGEDWLEPYNDSEENPSPGFVGSSFVFADNRENEGIREAAKKSIDKHFEKGDITKVTVRYRTKEGG